MYNYHYRTLSLAETKLFQWHVFVDNFVVHEPILMILGYPEGGPMIRKPGSEDNMVEEPSKIGRVTSVFVIFYIEY